MRTGAGYAFDTVSVKWVRHSAKIKSLKERLLEEGCLTVKQVSARPGIGGGMAGACERGSRRLVESLGHSHLDVAWLSDVRHGVLSAGDDPGLRTIDTETGRLSWLLPSSTATQPAVSRDGTRIAFVEGALRFSIVEMPLDGSAPRPLVRSRLTLQYPSWAPRSNRFLYVRQEEIVLHDRDSGAERTLVSRRSFPQETGMIEFIDPVLSPDEARIAFALRTSRGEGIWVA
jgi:hypothetical protein